MKSLQKLDFTHRSLVEQNLAWHVDKKMFNTITVSLLNRFLGDYLDITDLDLSLWEGEFTLSNVAIKSTAISAFRLPYHVVAGNVGKLAVKLPWRNIYTSPVEVVLSDVNMVIIASKMVPYDALAEESELLNYKMAHLRYLEDKEKELEQRQGSADSSSSDHIPLTQSPSFSENLVKAIKRNLYVRIESLHIRFEDNGPDYRPFCLGLVLSKLTLETTNEKGVKIFVPEEMPTLYKLLNLHGFSVYMNTGENITKYREANPPKEVKAALVAKLTTLVNGDAKKSLKYIIGPIVTSVLSAQLRTVSNPEKSVPPFSVPKTVIDMNLQKFSLGMSAMQFANTIRLSKKIAEFSGSVAQEWRKYRPMVSHYRGHYKEWWKFAINCTLSNIKRKRNYWTWKHFKKHIRRCKDYTDALLRAHFSDTYSNLLTKWMTSNLLALGDSDEECIRVSEKKLNILSLMLCRKKAQLKAERHEAFARRHHSGWFNKLYDLKIFEEHSDALTQYLAQPWTREEKQRIVLAADFCESEEPPPDPGSRLIYPLSFIGLRAGCSAKELDLTVRDYESNPEGDQILQVKISGLQFSIESRPASNGSKLNLRMKSIEITGQTTQAAIDDEEPNYLLRAVSLKPGQNLDICYEKYPLDSPSADEKLTLSFSANAIELYNHATTLQRIAALIERANRRTSRSRRRGPANSDSEWLEEFV